VKNTLRSEQGGPGGDAIPRTQRGGEKKRAIGDTATEEKRRGGVTSSQSGREGHRKGGEWERAPSESSNSELAAKAVDSASEA